jgi:Fe-S cluster biogenesis protein NfuA
MTDVPSPAEPVKIRAEPSAVDPDACKFVVSRTVHPGGPFFFDRPEKAEGSPLVEALFRLQGIRTVLVSANVVTVGKTADANWAYLLKPIGAAIRAQLTTGVPALVADAPALKFGDRTDGELKGALQELIDREINPGIASHGGAIHVVDVKDGVLYLRMEGGCQGCSASTVTLRQGVEVVVKKHVREIRDIVDVTDHASGSNPYLTRDTWP